VLRIAGLFNIYFFEEDEISIAAGVAALVRDNVGDFYRYTPQLGYYRLIEIINLLLGGNVNLIPGIMKYLSALMGTLIPALGLFLFKNELSEKTRWLTAFVLLANPIIWKSSQYGNTAMVATGISLIAITLLSNKPAKQAELLALVLFASSILMRADTVLLSPLIAFLFYRNHASARTAIVYMVVLGAVLLALYGLLFLFDPRIDNAGSAVSAHFSLTRPTLFWEYLLWAVSPIPLIFSLFGLRRLLAHQSGLLILLLIWFVPTMAFYFASTTTPRYFLLTVAPLAIAAAIGMVDMKNCLQQWLRPNIAWLGVFAAAFIHLFIGLGHFQSSWRTSPLYGPGFRTDDGMMPTGALLYDTYARGGFLHQSFNHAGFSKAATPYWEGTVFNQAIDVLAGESGANTTLILFDEGFWHAFHYHAQERGAEYLSRAPTAPSHPFASETWLKLGNRKVMTITLKTRHYAALNEFNVKAGDEIWLLGDSPFPNAATLEKLPPGLKLVPADSFSEKIQVFSVQSEAS